MRKSILIFTLFLLIIPLLYAIPSSDVWRNGKIANYTFETTGNFTGCTAADNLTCDQASKADFINELLNATNNGNYSCEFKLYFSTIGDNDNGIEWYFNNASGVSLALSKNPDGSGNMYWGVNGESGFRTQANFFATNQWYQVRLTLFQHNDTTSLYVLGTTNEANIKVVSAGSNWATLGYKFIRLGSGQSRGTYISFDNFTCYNATSYDLWQSKYSSLDTTPPVITGYSNQGSSCTNWNTNPSNPCSTSDTTPTLYFNTSEFAFCAIGINNWNYTRMGSSRNCTIGEGTREHACDLTSQEELVYEDSLVYLSCKDTSGNMNTTSTSGALSLTVTGLEASGDAAIGGGVQNALLSGYTNYSTQPIHSRNLSNAQARGTFDWMAKKGSKVWAFNYVTKGEQHVNMLNLTPTLYILEMSNITTSNITKAVELMVNATK